MSSADQMENAQTEGEFTANTKKSSKRKRQMEVDGEWRFRVVVVHSIEVIVSFSQGI